MWAGSWRLHYAAPPRGSLRVRAVLAAPRWERRTEFFGCRRFGRGSETRRRLEVFVVFGACWRRRAEEVAVWFRFGLGLGLGERNKSEIAAAVFFRGNARGRSRPLVRWHVRVRRPARVGRLSELAEAGASAQGAGTRGPGADPKPRPRQKRRQRKEGQKAEDQNAERGPTETRPDESARAGRTADETGPATTAEARTHDQTATGTTPAAAAKAGPNRTRRTPEAAEPEPPEPSHETTAFPPPKVEAQGRNFRAKSGERKTHAKRKRGEEGEGIWAEAPRDFGPPLAPAQGPSERPGRERAGRWDGVRKRRAKIGRGRVRDAKIMPENWAWKMLEIQTASSMPNFLA